MKADSSLISKNQRKNTIKEIIGFFKNERNEEIGIIAAEGILDNFLYSIGKEIYNKGVNDSAKFVSKRFNALELDMDSLLKK